MHLPTLSSYLSDLPGDGLFSVWTGSLEGEPALTLNADSQHYAASLMKVPLVLAAYRRADEGSLDLGARVEISNVFSSVHDGSDFSLSADDDSDPQTWQRMGTRVALRWLANRAIVVSGNLATNLLLDAVGFPAVDEALKVTGTTHTQVVRGIEDAAARDAGLHNLVTAADLAGMLREVAAHRAASSESCDEVLATLAAQQINDCIPPGLPPGTRVAHKTGWVDGVAHDAAIVYPDDSPPYVLSVCTTSTLSDVRAREWIAGAAAASWADRGAFQ